MHLRRYRGMDNEIIKGMYDEWLEMRCVNLTLKHGGAVELNVHAEDVAERLMKFVQGSDAIAFVTYGSDDSPPDEIYHVALLMIRQNHGVEYVDCMADPENTSRVTFEQRCSKLCKEVNKEFVGSNELFAYNKDTKEFDYHLPQCTQNVFVDLYYFEDGMYFFREIDIFIDKKRKDMKKLVEEGVFKVEFIEPILTRERGRMEMFAQRYGMHEGRDCIFWASHIASEVFYTDMPVMTWFDGHAWFNTKRNINIMEAGASIIQYITNAMFASLLQCRKYLLTAPVPQLKDTFRKHTEAQVPD